MEMIDNTSKVFVIGGDHYNTYGIVRSLGEEGIKSCVLILGSKSRDSFVLRSRYVERGNGCLTHGEAIAYLKKCCDERGKNIVICCSDEAEELVLNHYIELSHFFVLPICSNYRETIHLMNKNSITELAKQYDIRVPETWQVFNRELPQGIQYPCITKPLTSTKGHKKDIVVCLDEEELRIVLEDESRCSDFIVQEYINYDKEISILGVVLADGTIRFSGCIDKLRTCMIGTTSFGVVVNNSVLGDNVTKLEAMMRNTGYRGLFSAEFLKKDGHYYFLEVNFRNDGNTYVATASNQNLPLQYVLSFTGYKMLEDDTPTIPCYFMLDIEDFLTLRHNHVSFSQWIRDIKRTNAFLVYNKLDIKPFKKKIERTIFLTMRRVWEKLGIVD